MEIRRDLPSVVRGRRRPGLGALRAPGAAAGGAVGAPRRSRRHGADRAERSRPRRRDAPRAGHFRHEERAGRHGSGRRGARIGRVEERSRRGAAVLRTRRASVRRERARPALRPAAGDRGLGARHRLRTDGEPPRARMSRQSERHGGVRGRGGARRPAVARPERDPRRDRRSRAGDRPAHPRRRGRRPDLPGGRIGDDDPGRCRHQRRARSSDRAGQLPLRADPHTRRGGAAAAGAARPSERDRGDRGQRPARPGALREPTGGAASGRRRSRRRPEASVDARRRVRPGGSRCRQLRARRPAVRSQGRRAGRRRRARQVVSGPAHVPGGHVRGTHG